ncbi:hypothetical protein C8J57DRAFT_1727998 [Mycena rebaudengoi]|nr:hypothetical protein C8J57DRAFT_1727998 [Mycena rebaudengoi]
MAPQSSNPTPTIIIGSTDAMATTMATLTKAGEINDRIDDEPDGAEDKREGADDDKPGVDAGDHVQGQGAAVLALGASRGYTGFAFVSAVPLVLCLLDTLGYQEHFLRISGATGTAMGLWWHFPETPHSNLIVTYRLLAAATTVALLATWDPPGPAAVAAAERGPLPFFAIAIPRAMSVAATFSPATRTLLSLAQYFSMCIHDTRELELLMLVCPQRGVAVETHNFWHTTIICFDFHAAYTHFGWLAVTQPSLHSSAAASAFVRITAYRHFCALLNYACLLAASTPCGRHTVIALRLGPVALCKDHYAVHRARWWGVCIKDGDLAHGVRYEDVRVAREDVQRAEGNVQDARRAAKRGGTPGVVEAAWAAPTAVTEALVRAQRAVDTSGLDGFAGNEDKGVFLGVHATCRACRGEALWRCAGVADLATRTRLCVPRWARSSSSGGTVQHVLVVAARG